MNKTELARKLQTLDGLDNDEKAVLLDLLRRQKRYGLVWEDAPENIVDTMTMQLPLLVERDDDTVHPVISDNAEAPDHLIIEGDNLAALTALSFTHSGRIDVIYIDPPYNTGKEFYYNDCLIEREHEFKHSRWAEFMYRRLRLARNLLAPDGLLFVSIDFHELPNLILICNEIFGESNFVANVTVKGNPRGRQSSIYFAQVDDALLVYRKSPAAILQGFEISDDTAKKRFNKTDPYGRKYEEWELRKRGAGARRSESPNLWYPVYYDEETSQLSTLPIGDHDIVITPKLSTGEDGRWRWSRDKFEAEKDALYVRKTRNGYNVFERKYPETKSRQLPPTIWDYPEVNTELGTKLLKEIMGDGVPFQFPKPIGLIRRILDLIPRKDVTVLDFFAGSGSTLHAVMQANAADGGSRTCILCNNNENRICEEITYERSRRVIKGYRTAKNIRVAPLSDNNLRYYRVHFVSREQSLHNARAVAEGATGLLCIKNDLYTEAPFDGRMLNPKFARYFAEGERRMLIIYDENVIPLVVGKISSMDSGSHIKVYVYAQGNYTYDDEFATVADRVTLVPIPQAIYAAYRNVLLPQKHRLLANDDNN